MAHRPMVVRRRRRTWIPYQSGGNDELDDAKPGRSGGARRPVPGSRTTEALSHRWESAERGQYMDDRSPEWRRILSVELYQ